MPGTRTLEIPTLRRHFTVLENGVGLTLICHACGDEILFTTHADPERIVNAVADHLGLRTRGAVEDLRRALLREGERA